MTWSWKIYFFTDMTLFLMEFHPKITLFFSFKTYKFHTTLKHCFFRCDIAGRKKNLPGMAHLNFLTPVGACRSKKIILVHKLYSIRNSLCLFRSDVSGLHLKLYHIYHKCTLHRDLFYNFYRDRSSCMSKPFCIFRICILIPFVLF